MNPITATISRPKKNGNLMSSNVQVPEVKVLPDIPALNRAAVDEISRCARESIAARGRFSIALSGGNTPRPVYSLLADDQKEPARRLPWEKIFVFFGDERHVPPTDPDSNYRMANESLLSRVPIPSQNVFRVQAELDTMLEIAKRSSASEEATLAPGE